MFYNTPPWAITTICMCNTINECDYSFLQEPFFPLDFRIEFFNEACAYFVNRPRGSVVKHRNLILEGKEKEES